MRTTAILTVTAALALGCGDGGDDATPGAREVEQARKAALYDVPTEAECWRLARASAVHDYPYVLMTITEPYVTGDRAIESARREQLAVYFGEVRGFYRACLDARDYWSEREPVVPAD